jgi:hypothetical protein
VDIWDVPDAEQAQQPLWCGYRQGLAEKYVLDRCAAAAPLSAPAAAELQHQWQAAAAGNSSDQQQQQQFRSSSRRQKQQGTEAAPDSPTVK